MRNILITGCSKGIGFEIVKTFAKNSSINIIGVARNDIGLAKLNQECKEINNNFINIISIDVYRFFIRFLQTFNYISIYCFFISIFCNYYNGYFFYIFK